MDAGFHPGTATYPLLNRPEFEQSIEGWCRRGGFEHEKTTGMFHVPQN